MLFLNEELYTNEFLCLSQLDTLTLCYEKIYAHEFARMQIPCRLTLLLTSVKVLEYFECYLCICNIKLLADCHIFYVL